MQLVELFDNLSLIFWNDPEFKASTGWPNHCPDDYLEPAPLKTVKSGAALYRRGQAQDWSLLYFAGWLPDSSEANVRNTLIGQAECANGKSTGLFPDTLEMRTSSSNPSKSGIYVAALVNKPMAWQPSLEDEQFTSSPSEMYWQGADGSRAGYRQLVQ